MKVIKRGSTYQLRRRVPRRYRSVEPRETIWISLHTDSEKRAREKATAAWAQLEQAWEARLAGDTQDAERRFQAVQELAEARGYRYLDAGRVAKLPLSELLNRVEDATDRQGEPDPKEAAALLGGVAKPEITVSRALDLFWGFAKDQTLGKSETQRRKWENPHKKAIGNFIAVIGDKPLAEIDADDTLAFREWWMDRLETEGLNPSSANKDLIHLGKVLKQVNRMKRLGLTLPLADLRFKEGEKVTRPPFSSEWIKDRLLKPGALDGLDKEARCIILGMVNTGYRPSEGAALTGSRIRLDTNVPHISIEPEGRTLKSPYSRREIPLAGVSLEAFRECRDGFPTYRDNEDLYKIVGSYFKANGLKETPKHSLYCLRHSFEDRMLAAGVDERIRRDLIGHRLNRERYGEGASLEHKAKLIQAIAF